MKNLILIFIAALAINTSFAQADAEAAHQSRNRRNTDCSKAFFDLSTGINNNGGILGVGADIHLSENASINAGVGLLSSWGFKVYAGGKYFPNPCHKKWAFGGGVTYSTGLTNFSADMETVYGKTEPVELELKPQANIFASAYRYWQLGRNKNRIYLQLGWTRSITGNKFTQLSGNQISSNSASVVRTIAPGGLIVGLGFSFGG